MNIPTSEEGTFGGGIGVYGSSSGDSRRFGGVQPIYLITTHVTDDFSQVSDEESGDQAMEMMEMMSGQVDESSDQNQTEMNAPSDFGDFSILEFIIGDANASENDADSERGLLSRFCDFFPGCGQVSVLSQITSAENMITARRGAINRSAIRCEFGDGQCNGGTMREVNETLSKLDELPEFGNEVEDIPANQEIIEQAVEILNDAEQVILDNRRVDDQDLGL